MKVLVTGAKGMLGTDLMEVLKADHEVTGLDLDDLDITNLEQTRKTIKELAPEVIVNCAAFTNVDGCEIQEDLAYQVNALGPRNLAVACEETGAALVHISTDYVFPGNGTSPYREHELTGPVSVYGKSKLAGENNIRHILGRHYIIRTAWLYGPNGNNFVRTMLRFGRERDVLTVVNDQTGSPTYTGDLADAIAELIKTPAYGTYHLTNCGVCTWYEFTKNILEDAGIKGVEVKPITTEQLNRPAPRPAYSVMDNFNWRLQGHKPLRNYREALKEYLSITKE